MLPNSFVSEDEYLLAHQFKEQGFVIRPVTDSKQFDQIQALLGEITANLLGCSFDEKETFLNQIHQKVALSN